MHRSHAPSSRFVNVAVIVFGLVLFSASSGMSNTLYFNGFETDTTDWTSDVARVPSGAPPSASGDFHATAIDGSFSRWGGYNYGAGNNVATMFREYTTSIDIFLNVDGGWANDKRFDFDSAISNSLGGFKRDFIFNGGFYNDATGPGANTNRFVITASNNSQPSGANARNPDRNPIIIDDTGWYTFQHHFYNNGGVLAADLSIYTAGSTLVNTWTLSDPSDSIAGIGGNRYAWFTDNDFGTLAIDNVRLTTADAAAAAVPLPLAAWAGLSLVGGLGGFRGFKRLRAR